MKEVQSSYREFMRDDMAGFLSVLNVDDGLGRGIDVLENRVQPPQHLRHQQTVVDELRETFCRLKISHFVLIGEKQHFFKVRPI